MISKFFQGASKHAKNKEAQRAYLPPFSVLLKSKLFLSLITTTTIIFTLAAAASIYYRKTESQVKSGLAKLIAEQQYEQVSTESNYAKKHSAFLQLSGAPENESDRQNFFKMGENAIILQDAEALDTITRKLESFGGGSNDEKARLEKFKTKASELYAVKARSKRFEISKINSKIDDIDRENQESRNDADKNEEKIWLEKTKAILLNEYPEDAERAVELNPDNFRAIYDLARFIQDKIFAYDKRIAIKHFEKVVELGNGKFEKDADYQRANLNLTVLYFQIGNWAKAKCYSSQTIEKFLARGTDDYDYLFGKTPGGNLNEPEFFEAVEKVNPEREMSHDDCAKFQSPEFE